MCRHPLDAAQVARTDAYAAALGEDGPGLESMRILVEEGAAAASDYLLARGIELAEAEAASAAIGDLPFRVDAPDPDLVARLRALGDLPEGTLGRAYFDFIVDNEFTFPGEAAGFAATFLQHDMCHVLCDYSPYGDEEIAVNTMMLGAADTDERWINLAANLALREAGFLVPEGYEPIAPGTLDWDGAAEKFADALRRGAECTGDLAGADLLSLAAEPLDAVRAQFGIPPRRI